MFTVFSILHEYERASSNDRSALSARVPEAHLSFEF
jgi:hypothetical protein